MGDTNLPYSLACPSNLSYDIKPCIIYSKFFTEIYIKPCLHLQLSQTQIMSLSDLPCLRSSVAEDEVLLFYRETANHWHNAFHEQRESANEAMRLLAQLRTQMGQIETIVINLLARRV